jgi:ATP-dependent protease ClpP protease subunit
MMGSVLADTSQDLFEKAYSGDDFRSVADFAVTSGISVSNFCSLLPVAKARNEDAWLTLVAASVAFLEAKGRSAKTCTAQNSRGDIPKEEARSILGDRTTGGALWEKETYNIDLLKIETFVSPQGTSTCSSGSEVVIRLQGQIGPDSSFAMSRLLERLPDCTNESGAIELPPTAVLHSAGGLLKDGYNLGRTLRNHGVKVHVEDQNICASSCAVAFLGGEHRKVEDGGQIMFHAPYFSGKNEYGEKDIDCDVGEESLTELKDYYISMTDKETGERLFERTMWYCSADDGWVVTGGAAAELFGIATER